MDDLDPWAATGDAKGKGRMTAEPSPSVSETLTYETAVSSHGNERVESQSDAASLHHAYSVQPIGNHLAITGGGGGISWQAAPSSSHYPSYFGGEPLDPFSPGSFNNFGKDSRYDLGDSDDWNTETPYESSYANAGTNAYADDDVNTEEFRGMSLREGEVDAERTVSFQAASREHSVYTQPESQVAPAPPLPKRPVMEQTFASTAAPAPGPPVPPRPPASPTRMPTVTGNPNPLPPPPYTPPLPSSFYSRSYANPPQKSLIRVLAVEGPIPAPPSAAPLRGIMSTAMSSAPIAKGVAALTGVANRIMSQATSIGQGATSSPVPPHQQYVPQQVPPQHHIQPVNRSPRVFFVNVSRISCIVTRPFPYTPTVILTSRLPGGSRNYPLKLPNPPNGPTFDELVSRLPPEFVVFELASHAKVGRGIAGGNDNPMRVVVNASRIISVSAFNMHWTTLVVEGDVRVKQSATAASGIGSPTSGGSMSSTSSVMGGVVKDEAERGLFSFEVSAPVLEVLQILDSDGFPLPNVDVVGEQ
ncbi:hypothetical protein HDU76_000529 [Blyttiomyces sp. JEL0837]|nr:hypothetical protein HDU76_000529 [Blyttiomyces sp. JEL0837]